jgi:heme-degrading monooxygenase HmoA
MPVIVVTRLRLRDHALLDDFFTAAVALLEQAKNSTGNLGTDVLAEANDTWWSCSAWLDRQAMRSYVSTDPHASTMARLDDWCDEASFGDWEQDRADLPDWQTAYQNLVAGGKSAELAHASAANATRSFPAPVEG